MAAQTILKNTKQDSFRSQVLRLWKQPHDRVLKIFLRDADSRGFPVIKDWPGFVEKYGSDYVHATLMYYILEYKLPMPRTPIELADIKDLFWRFSTKTISPFIHESDMNSPLMHRLSTHPYKYDYDEHTLGYFPQNTTANKISNYFAQSERLLCEVLDRESTVHLWTTEKGMSRFVDVLRRLPSKSMSEADLKKVFSYAGQVAAQFNVNTAKNIYNVFPGETIFDISCGWGDRLTGFYLSNKSTYIGTDPNEKMFEIYKEMCLQYESWLGKKGDILHEGDEYFEIRGKKNVRIYNLPAEDLPYKDLPNIDITFSSPPYFNRELYAKDSAKESNQSWNRYSSDNEWLNGFLYVVLDNIMPKSRSTLVNITDIGTDAQKNRVFICDPMVDRYRDEFRGMIGFQLSRLMNIENVNNGTYTEPIWVFGEKLPLYNKKDLMSIF